MRGPKVAAPGERPRVDGPGQVPAFERALLRGDRAQARAVLRAGLGDDDPVAVSEAVVVPALEHIGAAWEAGDISLATLYLSGVLAEEVVADVLPSARPAAGDSPGIAIVVLEDHHVLGKRLVLSALRSAGYAVEDYGHGLSPREVVARCHAREPRILLVSTLMLPAALKVRTLADEFAGLDRRPALFVGGAPFRLDPELWREVGADGAGRNSADALRLVRSVLQEGSR
jgi:methanogenic corrinoid protein MtbC1